MFSEDFVLRMINQAVAVLVQVIGLKKAGQLEQARQAIDQALEILFGLRGDLVRGMDDSGLLALLNLASERDLERLAIIADLFREDGEVLTAQGRSAEGAAQLARALRFYLEVALGGLPGEAPELAGRIDRLYVTMNAASLPTDTQLALLDYYERRLVGEAPGPASGGMDRQQVDTAVAALRRRLGNLLE